MRCHFSSGLFFAFGLAAAVSTWAQGTRDSFPWFERPARERVLPDVAIESDRLAEALDRHEMVAVDLRSDEAYRNGHLPGAVRLDLPAAFDLVAARTTLGRQGLCGPWPLVLYGEASDLLALGRAFFTFEAAGYPAIRVLPGGYAAWETAAGRVERGPSVRPPCSFDPPARPGVLVDRDWLADHFDLPEVELLDLRDATGWTGGRYDAPPRFSAGHLPHSLPLDVAALLSSAGRWPALAAARDVLASLGPRIETRVNLDSTFVLYGEGPDDPRPELGYLLLRSLGVDAKVFAGGFQSWSDNHGPIVRIASTGEIKGLLARTASRPDAPPDGALVFDLREEWDFRDGHLPGAESLPSHEFAAQLETRVARRQPAVDRLRVPLVLYCYGRQCVRSRDCATIAARHGFRDIVWYRDGIDAWRREGGTLARSPGDLKAGDIYRILRDVSRPPEPPRR